MYFEYPEHKPSPNAVICSIKLCENCGRSFTRTFQSTRPLIVRNFSDGRYSTVVDEKTIFVDRGRKFCATCCGKMLLPVDDEVYREAVPKIPGRSLHLIRYDDSLIGGPQEARAIKPIPRKKRKYTDTSVWKDSILKASETRGGLTTEQMVDFLPACYTPKDAYVRVRLSGLLLIKVGQMPRNGLPGRSPFIYRVVER